MRGQSSDSIEPYSKRCIFLISLSSFIFDDLQFNYIYIGKKEIRIDVSSDNDVIPFCELNNSSSGISILKRNALYSGCSWTKGNKN